MQKDNEFYNKVRNSNQLSKSLDSPGLSPIFGSDKIGSSLHQNGPLFLNSNNSIFSKLGTNIMGKKLNVPDFNRKKGTGRPYRITDENSNLNDKAISIKPEFGIVGHSSNRSLVENKRNYSSIFEENLLKENSLLNIAIDDNQKIHNLSIEVAPKNNIFNNSININEIENNSNEIVHNYLSIKNFKELVNNFNIFEAWLNLDLVRMIINIIAIG